MNIPTTAFFHQTSHPVWQLALRWANRQDRRHLWEWDWSRWLINLSEKMGSWIFQLPMWWCAIMHADSLEMSHPHWRWSGPGEDQFPGFGVKWCSVTSATSFPRWLPSSAVRSVLPDPGVGLKRRDKWMHYSSCEAHKRDHSFGWMKAAFIMPKQKQPRRESLSSQNVKCLYVTVSPLKHQIQNGDQRCHVGFKLLVVMQSVSAKKSIEF